MRKKRAQTVGQGTTMAIKDLFHLSRFPGSSVHPREERPRNRVKRVMKGLEE